MLQVETKSGKKTNIKISVYIPEHEPIGDIGLWKHGEILMPGAKHREQLSCLESATGAKRYITGLNELDPSVMSLPEKERVAKVQEIRKDIVHLEKLLIANAIDDKWLKASTSDFMEKVQMVRPDNAKLWDTILITLANGDLFLDVENNPYDFLKLRAIEAGGFDSIAPSYSEAKKTGTSKWYLNREEKTTSDKVILSKIKNKAIAELDKLFSNDVEKLRFVLKAILIDCSGYKPSTPHDALYEDADAYINGRGEERSIKRAAQTFSDFADKKLEDLKLLSIVKDASIYNFLITKGDGKIYHAKSSSMLGANIEEVISYMKNPLNENVLLDVQAAVEKEWQN